MSKMSSDSDSGGGTSHNYNLYAHIAEMSIIAFSNFYFYRKCVALEEKIAKLESVRVTEAQEVDPKVIDALAAHVYARVMSSLEVSQKPRKAAPRPTTTIVETSDEPTVAPSGPTGVGPDAVHFEEYRGSDRDELDKELEKEL